MTLRLVSAGAAQGLVRSLARQEGISLEGHFGAVGAMLDRLTSGEPCDVVILTRAQIDTLARDGRVDAATVADLGAVPTSIAVRAGAPLPDVRDADGVRAALLAADAIYFPDAVKSTAGAHFAKVASLLGIAETVAACYRTYPNGATAMGEMAKASGRPIGCTQSTEILATPGVTLVAPLPAGLDLSTTYTAAVSSQAEDARSAARFVAALTSAASAAARRAAGFE